MSGHRICAVVPAAGEGTRLGLGIPKIAAEIAEDITVWHLLYEPLRQTVEHVHVVVSAAGEPIFRRLAAEEIRLGAVSVSVQEKSTGTGDAIFGAARHWDTYETVVVVWGDQSNLSPVTVRRAIDLHSHAVTGRPRLTVPLVSIPDPYVEYEINGTQLERIRMSREGDECRPGGLSDVGVFCLSTAGLLTAWQRYRVNAIPGATTGKMNFLPFLPYLSRVCGWPIAVVPILDLAEARGINTQEDLAYARQRFRR